jgi:hypothetical protein
LAFRVSDLSSASHSGSARSGFLVSALRQAIISRASALSASRQGSCIDLALLTAASAGASAIVSAGDLLLIFACIGTGFRSFTLAFASASAFGICFGFGSVLILLAFASSSAFASGIGLAQVCVVRFGDQQAAILQHQRLLAASASAASAKGFKHLAICMVALRLRLAFTASASAGVGISTWHQRLL